MNKYDEKMKALTDFPGSTPPAFATHLSEEELDAVEQQLGHTLPTDYREFLRDYGGYSTIAAIVFPEGHEPTYGACEGFHGVVPSIPGIDLVSIYRNVGPGWPRELLRFAGGDNGDMCMVIAGPKKGAIYFLHTQENWDEEFQEHLHFVAHSFDEFMSSLKV